MSEDILKNDKIDITTFCSSFGKSYFITFKNGYNQEKFISDIKRILENGK